MHFNYSMLISFLLSRDALGLYSERTCVCRIYLFVVETGKFWSGDCGQDNLINAVQRLGFYLFLPVVLLIDSGQLSCTDFSWVDTGDVILGFWLTWDTQKCWGLSAAAELNRSCALHTLRCAVLITLQIIGTWLFRLKIKLQNLKYILSTWNWY